MRSVVRLAALTVAGVALPLAPPAAADSTDCPAQLDMPVRGERAVAALGPDVPDAAKAAGMGRRLFTEELRADRTLWIDVCGHAFYMEPTTPAASTPESPATAADPLALHSRPGSERTIFLDFDGHEIAGTGWNASYTSGTAFTAAPFTRDTDPAFSSAELAAIEDVWRRVAEDYAPFDVDVTTQDPGAAALTRSGSGDRTYGTRVVISPTTTIYTSCRCGGIAYLGAFDRPTGHEYLQPALVFTQGVGTGSKRIAEAASHEAGHTLALLHDGTSTSAYYAGHNSWAPIMGVGYSRPVTQWAAGEYTDADNHEDDLAVIAANGAPRVDDDIPTEATLAGGTATGMIGTAADRDTFTFTASGATAIHVSPSVVSPNLDARLTVRAADGTVIATSDPAVSTVSADIADGLGASLDLLLAPGLYSATVDGVGAGTAASGYSDYGSLGRYVLTVDTTPALVVIPGAAVRGRVGAAFRHDLAAGGGSTPYTWSATGLPPGLVLTADGAITGTPRAAGTYPTAVEVTDADGERAGAVVEIRIEQAPIPVLPPAESAPPPASPSGATPAPPATLAITTRRLRAAAIGKRYHVRLNSVPAGTNWVRVSGALPKGLRLTPGGVVRGVPRVRGRYPVIVAVTAAGLRAERSLVLRVRR